MGLHDVLKQALTGRRADMMGKMKSPPGLGGYRVVRLQTVLLDPRQKFGVPFSYAELVNRNKYDRRLCRQKGNK